MRATPLYTRDRVRSLGMMHSTVRRNERTPRIAMIRGASFRGLELDGALDHAFPAFIIIRVHSPVEPTPAAGVLLFFLHQPKPLEEI